MIEEDRWFYTAMYKNKTYHLLSLGPSPLLPICLQIMPTSAAVYGITSPVLELRSTIMSGLLGLRAGCISSVPVLSCTWDLISMVHPSPQDLHKQFTILYLAEVMVGVGEVEVAMIAVHELEGAVKEDSIANAVAILNFEWPRSDTIRRRGLESSSADLPCSLLMLVGEERKVVGHAKVSKVPALPKELFVESVVVHPGLRGMGLGKLLMLKVRSNWVE